MQPDNNYQHLTMQNNAVPVEFARRLALKIADDLRSELADEYKKMAQDKKKK